MVIDHEQTGVGSLAGSAIGGIGSAAAIGRSNGSLAAGTLGAIAGGMVGMRCLKPGEQTARARDHRQAGRRCADEAFRPGERVRLLSSGGITRVTH
ncbi:putative lipoprotein [Ralstonia insidiosa]|uniref:Lipoprotein n=1 Tax=Ralstonia insidiosa TaxID=190721 RepID=A0AAC9FV85_9RALS|nr:putative lipoprotein [Ralstonia insidiosa]